MQDDIQTPLEAEIVSDPSIPEVVQANLDLVGMINNYVAQMDGINTEVHKYRDMLNSMFESDATYQTHDLAVKEAQKVRNATKKQIMKLPQAADLASRIQDLKKQTKELGTSLSDYLKDYEKTTGSRHIEGLDGQIREIVYTAKLVKKLE